MHSCRMHDFQLKTGEEQIITMDLRKLKKLIDLIKESGIGEIEIHEGEESVRITREVPGQTPVVMAQPYMSAAVASQPAAPTAPEPAPAKPIEAPAAAALDKHVLKAPMVGTVYLSATPGSKPFVEIGQPVKAGDVICL